MTSNIFLGTSQLGTQTLPRFGLIGCPCWHISINDRLQFKCVPNPLLLCVLFFSCLLLLLWERRQEGSRQDERIVKQPKGLASFARPHAECMWWPLSVCAPLCVPLCVCVCQRETLQTTWFSCLIFFLIFYVSTFVCQKMCQARPEGGGGDACKNVA